MTEIFNTVLINPIINTLVAIYKLLLFTGLPFTLGFSIIILTVLVRLLIFPLITQQLISAKKMQEIKPHLDRIKEKHKNDKMRQQQEMAAFYKQSGINPAAGCLPVLVQLPIFLALYNVLIKVVGQDTTSTVDAVNKVLYSPSLYLDKAWDPNFFGISLTATPLGAWQISPILLIVPVLTGLLQFIQSKMMSPQQPKTEIQNKTDDFQKVMQTQMLYFFPFIIGFFSFTFPVGLSLYWNTFTVFGIIQQNFVNKKYGRTNIRANN